MTEITSRLSSALADRYRVEPELGAGGLATVYPAHVYSSAEALAPGRRLKASLGSSWRALGPTDDQSVVVVHNFIAELRALFERS